jgi:hypothetical protein
MAAELGTVAAFTINRSFDSVAVPVESRQDLGSNTERTLWELSI